MHPQAAAASAAPALYAASASGTDPKRRRRSRIRCAWASIGGLGVERVVEAEAAGRARA